MRGSRNDPDRAPLDVVLVGAGERARSWLSPLCRAGRLRAVGLVARAGEALLPDLPLHRSLDDALAAHPAAAFAVALPPRSGLEHALHLAALGRAAVVQAPLHDSLAEVELPALAERVRVAHGWVTLPGVPVLRALLRHAGGGRLGIEVNGAPEAEDADAFEALVHALALLRALLPDAAVTAAHPGENGSFELVFAAGSENAWQGRLRVRARGQSVSLRAEGGSETAEWMFQRGRETLRGSGVKPVRERTPPDAAVRALAQLLPGAARGDSLAEAASVLRLTRDCLDLLPFRLPPGARVFRQAASIAARRRGDLLGRLGLRGEVPAARDALAAAAPPLPREPFELWAFRAGLKPVVFLTVPPERVDETLAHFGDVACERRERRVRIAAQDRWDDRRDEGEGRVELYISRDLASARRMAELQADVDPTRALRELGELAGYPACCVDAFARQDDRANNSRNRYFTQARTSTDAAPWPWELNNLHTMVVPFFPCSYRCAAALEWARAVLAEMGRVHPQAVRALQALLARPVLYFEHEHQLVFDGTAAGDSVDYRSVTLPGSVAPPMAALASAIAAGDRLTFSDLHLRVERGGAPLLVLDRTDPALGFLAPFG